jgi:CAAX prenyl protease-like protein
MDEIAYWAPMGAFLVLTAAGSHWPQLYAVSYAIKTFTAAGLLIYFRKHYTPIRWNFWWLGLIVGTVGIVQWIVMQHVLEKHFAMFRPGSEPFDPTKAFSQPAVMYAFIALRMVDAALMVPFMEELFWRDWLWRTTIAPNDFKLAGIGEWSLMAFLVVAGAMGSVHGNWWLTAIVWAMLVGGLLVYTKSLEACICAHFASNLLLGIYVLLTHEWSLW